MTHISTFSQDPSIFPKSPKPSCQSRLPIPLLKSALQFTSNTGFLLQFLLIVAPAKASRFKSAVILDASGPHPNTIKYCQFSVYKNSRDFPGGAVVKNPPANAGDMGSSPGLGRSHMPQSN